jgi:PilZ domain-containing protein
MQASRAQRLPLNTPIRYRLATEAKWHSGMVENFSQSGMLIHGDKRIGPNLILELCIELPQEAASEDRVKTFFKARVVRAVFPLDSRKPGWIAVALMDGWIVRETPTGDLVDAVQTPTNQSELCELAGVEG